MKRVRRVGTGLGDDGARVMYCHAMSCNVFQLWARVGGQVFYNKPKPQSSARKLAPIGRFSKKHRERRRSSAAEPPRFA